MDKKIIVTYSSTGEKTINEVIDELIKSHLDETVKVIKVNNEIIKKAANG